MHGDEAERVRRWQRLRKEKTLRILAAQGLQPGRVRFTLNALDDDGALEVMGERDDRFQHDFAVRLGLRVLVFGKGALIDLDRVEGQILELAETRCAGTEIVDHDADAKGAALLE